MAGGGETVSQRQLRATDWLILNQDVDDTVFLVLTDKTSYPRNSATQEQHVAGLPISAHGVAHAHREIGRRKLSYVDRPGQDDLLPGRGGYRRPVQLRNVKREADPRAGGRFVALTPDAIGRLRGKGGPAAARLLFLYGIDQTRMGKVQRGDREAARALGRTVEEIRTMKQRLIKDGIVRKLRKGSGPYDADVLVIKRRFLPLAGRVRFDPSLTRYDRRLECLDDAVVYANEAEAELIVRLTSELTDARREEIRAQAKRLESAEDVARAGSLLDALRDLEHCQPDLEHCQPDLEHTNCTNYGLRTSKPSGLTPEWLRGRIEEVLGNDARRVVGAVERAFRVWVNKHGGELNEDQQRIAGGRVIARIREAKVNAVDTPFKLAIVNVNHLVNDDQLYDALKAARTRVDAANVVWLDSLVRGLPDEVAA